MLNNGSAACFACSTRFIVYKQDSFVGYIFCKYQLSSLNISIKRKLEVLITVDKQHQFASVYFEKRPFNMMMSHNELVLSWVACSFYWKSEEKYSDNIKMWNVNQAGDVHVILFSIIC